MNIGIVTTWYERGAAYVSKAYMKALQKQGNDVFIFARGGSRYGIGDPNWDLPNVTWGVRYDPLGGLSGFSTQYVNMNQFERWLHTKDINIVIFNEEHAFDTVKRVHDLGYIVGAYVDYYREDTVKHFKEYDFLLCNTKRHYGVFQDYPGCLFIPWGTDINLFKPQNRTNYKDPCEGVVFFHSAGWGGVNLRKGTDLVLKAFQHVRGKARLIVHSQSPLCRYGDAVAEIVRRDQRIEFIERTVTAPGLYYLGDVFVYPSRLEGIGLCIAEGLACGLPVIATDVAPMNEFIQDGSNGLLVRVAQEKARHDGYYWPESIADTGDLAKKMQMYVDDRELLISHQRQARESAMTRLNWERNAAQLGAELQTTLKKPKARRRPHFLEHVCWTVEAEYVGLLTRIGRVIRKEVNRSQVRRTTCCIGPRSTV